MRLQYLLLAVVALASSTVISATGSPPQTRSLGETSNAGAEKRSLRSAKTLDDDEQQGLSDAEEERVFGFGGKPLTAAEKVEKMMANINAGKVKTKYFKYFDDADASPSTLYINWGFARNGENPSDPKFQFWEKYRDWYYKKYPHLVD